MVYYDNIPEELKKLDQWVCANDGSKVPMKAWENKPLPQPTRKHGLISRLLSNRTTSTITTTAVSCLRTMGMSGLILTRGTMKTVL